MSFVVYARHKNGSLYAYRAESFRDPVSKQPRQKRTYLGKVDEETNTIIPKKTKDRNAESDVTSSNSEETAPEMLQNLLESVALIQKQNAAITHAFVQLAETMQRVSAELQPDKA